MTEWTGGLPRDIDYMFPERPADPEMRESASVWFFEENGRFALPRVGIEAQGAVWDTHRHDMNLAYADGRVLRESAVGRSQPPIGPGGRPDTLGSDDLTFRCIEPYRRWTVSYGATYGRSRGHRPPNCAPSSSRLQAEPM